MARHGLRRTGRRATGGPARAGMETGPVGQVRVDPALWTSATLPPRRHSATRCGPGWPSTWSGEFAALGPGGGPADETGWDLRIEWERLLGADRWVGLSWPEEYGGRDAGIVEQVIFNEEYAKAERAGADQLLRRGPVRPDADRVRHRGAEAALPPQDPVGRGAVVPGVLGAERRLRPRERPDPRRARRRRVGHQRPEGVDDARAPRRLVLRASAAPIPSRPRTRASRTS